MRVAANQGRNWVLDADVKDCFGSIDHDALIAQIERRVVDRRLLKLIRSWLRAGVLDAGVVTDTVAGTPQGSPISPLLANIALHVLDEAWVNEGGQRFGVLVRYADDFVVISPDRRRVEQAQQLAITVLARVGLRLHPDKTRLADLREGREGFDFLGFHHRKVLGWRYRNRFYLQRWPSPKALASIRVKIAERTHRRFVGLEVRDIVASLNPVLRGWGNYFRWGNSARQFSAIDRYVHLRLAMFASTKHGLHGRNWTTRFTNTWLNQLPLYHLSGNVRRVTPHAQR